MKFYSRSFLTFAIAFTLTCPLVAHANTPKPPAPIS